MNEILFPLEVLWRVFLRTGRRSEAEQLKQAIDQVQHRLEAAATAELKARHDLLADDVEAAPVTRRKAGERRWWVSWVQPTPDFRPLTDPPNEAILGWWCSGYDSGDLAILCAAVIGKTEAAAKRAVAKDWPESKAASWRFSQQMESLELSDRFPLNGWAKERFERERGA